MKLCAAVICISMLMSCSAALANNDPSSSTPSSSTVQFVDLDGDGLHDLMTDSDNDGIPDKVTEPESSTPVVASSTGIFAGGTDAFTAPPPETNQSNSTRFNSRYSLIKCLAASRGGFGSGDDFGPGNGIGIGNVSGGQCVGGICF